MANISLPPGVQPLVDELRALLGLPAVQLQIHLDPSGTVQAVHALVVYKHKTAIDTRAEHAHS